tara:strand:+ start:579 stop:1232 length:654 start_codon:yes stop_codon:yes gene_type:complete
MADLAKNSGGAIAAANTSSLIQGSDSDDFSLPELHLFQDVGNESDTYGDHDKGVYVNSLTNEVVDTSEIIPVIAQKQCVVWHHRDSGNKGLAGVFSDRKSVPETLQAGNGTEYDIVEYVNLICIVVSEPDLPFLLRHKSSALTAIRTLNTLEMGRMNIGKGRGVYNLTAKQKSNDQGKWFVPQYVPKGDASEDMIAMATSFASMFGNREIPADNIPI